MKLDGNWIEADPTQRVCAVLTDAGYRALLVGGCVRNALLGVPVGDIDIATDATPEIVIELAENAGLRAIPTGLAHGTITVVADSIPHEITTFRTDVETDGRHARVAYSTDLNEDAKRRDFTMNALYAEANGTVIDPLDGMADLKARRVRFVGDPMQRLTEDHLRALRFFRFHAWYGDARAGMDADALDAIARSVDGLARLSAERVTSELVKLLGAVDPAPAVACMQTTGVLNAVLPGAEHRALAPLVHIEQLLGLPPDPMVRLAALRPEGSAPDLRLSKAQAKALAVFAKGATGPQGAAELAYRHGPETALGIMALRSALLETPLPEHAAEDAARGGAARFPVTARDLMGKHQGPALGVVLKQLERAWISSDFALDRDALIERANRG